MKYAKLIYPMMVESKKIGSYYKYPINNKILFYAPEKGIIAKAGKHEKGLNSKFKKFIKNQKSLPKLKNEMAYNQLTVFLTNACNLNCIYCYAHDEHKKEFLKFDLFKRVFDFLINKIKDKFVLEFHGGGEPFIAFDLMEKIYDYAKEVCLKKGIKLETRLGTNGTLKIEHIKWIKKNKVLVSLSFDGPPEIQDKQRPFKNGSPSYPVLKHTVNLFNKFNVNYGVGVVVTKNNVARMLDIVKHFKKLGVRTMAFNVLSECGNALNNKVIPPTVEDFVKNYMKAFNYAEKTGISLSDFGLISSFRNQHCGACGTSLFLTIAGYISTCYEVTSNKHFGANTFIIGKVTKRGLIFKKNKLEYLKKRKNDQINACNNCISKWGCAGGCPLNSLRKEGDIFKTVQYNCAIKKQITLFLLNKLVEGGIKMPNLDFAMTRGHI